MFLFVRRIKNHSAKMGKLILFFTGCILCLYSPITRTITRYNEQNVMILPEGSIGKIEISVIDVNLPIFSGVDEEVLGKGIGYMKESSPLGGGENTHSILAGHCGGVKADMFLRLKELKQGDEFVLYVEECELVYEVCQIQVVLPTETEMLKVQKGRDLVSLVTCTPYGINTHRLVVTGERKT